MEPRKTICGLDLLFFVAHILRTGLIYDIYYAVVYPNRRIRCCDQPVPESVEIRYEALEPVELAERSLRNIQGLS
jgi:hypothetical protein